MQRNGKFAVDFEGMEHKVDLESAIESVIEKKATIASLKLRAINLSTDPCLPKPWKTNKNDLITIGMLLVTLLMSLLFDAYSRRWRPQICNLFYLKRAQQRARFVLACMHMH